MKDHLPLLKETLQFMVQQLRAEDKLCLITFDHEVNHHHTITVATQPWRRDYINIVAMTLSFRMREFLSTNNRQ